MSFTDVLLTTDFDGTQHWARFYGPDEAGTFNYNQDETTTATSGHQHFVDATGLGGTASFFQVEFVANVRSREAAMLYWESPGDFDVDLPSGAAIEGRAFRYSWAQPDATAYFVSVTFDLWDDVDAVIKPTTPTNIEALVLGSLRQSFADGSLPAGFTTSPMTTYDYSLSDADWALLTGFAGSTLALRFALWLSGSGIGSAVVTGNLIELGLWGDTNPTIDQFGPAFVQYFSIAGTHKPAKPSPPAPRWHNAKQVMAAAQQPPIIFGTNPR